MRDSEIAVVCAWCGSQLRDGSGETVSHGICPTCSAAFLSEARKTVHEAGPRHQRRSVSRRRRRWSPQLLIEAALTTTLAFVLSLGRCPSLKF